MLLFCIFSVRRYCINWTQLQHFSGGQWLIYKQLFPLFHKYIYVHSLCTDRRLKHKHLFFKFEQVPSYITVRGNLQWTASVTTNRFLLLNVKITWPTFAPLMLLQVCKYQRSTMNYLKNITSFKQTSYVLQY